jgi:hypothetical protein
LITALVDCLAAFCQTDNMRQVEVIARSMLAAIPDDIVALQFLGLALYRMGRIDDARRAFVRAEARQTLPDVSAGNSSACETAGSATMRAATRAHSGLAESWYRIAQILTGFGLHLPARRALGSAHSSLGNS